MPWLVVGKLDILAHWSHLTDWVRPIAKITWHDQSKLPTPEVLPRAQGPHICIGSTCGINYKQDINVSTR